MNMETKKYRIVFLSELDYKEIFTSIPNNKLSIYAALKDAGIENFSIGQSECVFVEEKYRATLNLKAKRGEHL